MRRNILMSALLVGCTALASAEEPKGKVGGKVMSPTQAAAWLIPTKGNEVYGKITITEENGQTHFRGEVTGLEPGKHGFHIHEFGDLRGKGGLSAGGHFNPTDAKHGGPDAAEHHLGDLGNIEANKEGVAKVDIQVKGLKVKQIIGRALVVHAKADDLKSQPSGDAGDRVSLGVIGFANPKYTSSTGDR